MFLPRWWSDDDTTPVRRMRYILDMCCIAHPDRLTISSLGTACGNNAMYWHRRIKIEQTALTPRDLGVLSSVSGISIDELIRLSRAIGNQQVTAS